MEPQLHIKVNIRGKHKLQRFKNISMLAKEKFKGNLSELINHTLNAYWGLDPDTGERLTGKAKKTNCC